MTEHEINKIIAECTEKEQLHACDIPELDLYIDQILTLVSSRIGEDGQAGLTKTMINNYSKDGLIKPVKGKKYSKEHIIQMILIYYLKGVLTISDIKRLFDGIYSESEFGGDDLVSCYEKLLSVRSASSEICGEIVEKIKAKQQLDTENDSDLFVMMLSFASLSDMLRSVVLGMIDEKYPKEKKTEDKQKKSST